MAIPNPARRFSTEPSPRTSDSTRSQDMQGLFLSRLRRLAWLRRSCSDQMEESILRVLDKSIYSTYCDCLELGLSDEARDLIRKAA